MLFGLEYAHWVRFPVGSRADFVSDAGQELVLTLAALDGERAILDVATDRTGATRDLGTPPRATLWAKPPARPRRPTGLQVPSAELLEELERIRGGHFLPLDPPLAEGKAVIDVAGEERLCRWAERRGRSEDSEWSWKAWVSEHVPGGVVRLEHRRANSLETWSLRSFESA